MSRIESKKASKAKDASRGYNSLEVMKSRVDFITNSYDAVAFQRDRWISKNKYYYRYLKKVLRFIIEPESSVLQIKCETGYYLDAIKPKYGLGIDYSSKMVSLASKKYPYLDFKVEDLENADIQKKFDYVLLINALGDIVDIQKMLSNFKKNCLNRSRLVIVNYNALWQPLINLANFFKLKIKQPTQNWLSPYDIKNFLHLAGYELVKEFNIILCPVYIPIISNFINNVIARLPLIQRLCLDHVMIAKKVSDSGQLKDYSVSVIIPCKDEEKNIESIVRRMPDMGKGVEIIFCDDASTDNTAKEVLRMKDQCPDRNIRLVKGPGICKSKNVWAGFKEAKNDMLMILDADATVIPEELPYFYEAITKGRGEFINGSRLVYPMQENAMPFCKMMGNKFFSLFFSYILDQRIKDTLCGTKVFWRSDYIRMEKYIDSWGIKDLWGDYDLLFSATKINLKIIDLPVHYFERVHGYTKMKKTLSNGIRMLVICFAALFKLKFFKK